ncbi:MAG TPA: hypothetical protein V6C90_14115 [Coleofasciculaceae cyanobacterium]
MTTLLKQTANGITEDSCRWMDFSNKRSAVTSNTLVSTLQSLVPVRNRTELFYLNGEYGELKDSVETVKLS